LGWERDFGDCKKRFLLWTFFFLFGVVFVLKIKEIKLNGKDGGWLS
jgi:hypothetical protein